ncbi:reverse transcriptase family protein [Colwellia piezophila]|uniref:reverse transcriptase family protein n=1 Tax=Colwellia piezophila TaxID=211668 RepID=UPI00037217E4|nr:reverse transcriptase family protein [Colwellia piezophila]
MNRWNPNIYHRNGVDKGFEPDYLLTLVQSGKAINSKHKPVIFTLSHLANVTDTQYSTLHEFVSRKGYFSNIEPHYRTFSIKKRTGGHRTIHAPHPVLKKVQSWIARNILADADVHEAAKAYKRGESIVDNALPHCESEWLLKLDICDFFHNCSERQVYYVFKYMNYSSLLSFELARLCTKIDDKRPLRRWNNTNKQYKIEEYGSFRVGSLPQGAPTSPALSNLICEKLDEILFMLSLKYSACYTRYADDLTFSFNNSSRAKVLGFKCQVSNELKKFGFEINKKKTRIIPPGARKIVTGLNVNGNKPSLTRELRDKIKADLYYCKKYGVVNHCEKNKYNSIVGFSNHMNGMISFVYSVNPSLAEKYKKQYEELDLPSLVL